ncbi:DNA-processing protein DprA [Rubrivirga litoralis]|uniref:DNA-processing protein DprA n=1 Tax=Rubrivirga litoralis TaxID=3075598 RepID=A0ABU3BMX2_9BACT|nr:DNA-processing protein DprA [Rubrivirga sp. F394]MDT0630641.1 DNA-processing protein DprA [Rubrivirga sp. F394]
MRVGGLRGGGIAQAAGRTGAPPPVAAGVSVGRRATFTRRPTEKASPGAAGGSLRPRPSLVPPRPAGRASSSGGAGATAETGFVTFRLQPPAPISSDPAPLALAYASLDGVGRVTAHRLIERFPTLDALRATPREQVGLRLKGAPNVEQTVAALFDDDVFRPALDRAEAEVAALRDKAIRVLAPGGAGWPAGLDALPRADRPLVLYAYGDPGALAGPSLAVLARAPLDGDPFETVQALARRVLTTPPAAESAAESGGAASGGAALIVGAQGGVDLALQKVALGAGARVAVVVEAGLARLRPAMRPGATAAVRAGGVLVSPFPMTHGPFEHDDRERALVQAALGAAVCAVAPPPDSPEDRAAAWAAEARRPLALVGAAPPEAAWTENALRVDGPASFDAVAGLLA